jgi:hypothetical protein
LPWHVGTSDECPESKPYAVIKDADGEVEGCHETREKAEAQMAALYASETKAWSSAYITALPDSAFACIDSSGRHYPHHDASGKVDLPHLRNALSRLAQEDTTSCGASHLRSHAKREGVGQKTEETEPMKAEQLTTTKWRVLAIPFGGPLKGGKDLDGEYFSPNTDIKADWFDRRPVLFHHAQDEALKDVTLGVEDDLEEEDDGWWATVWLDRANQYWERVSKLLAAGKMYGSSGALGHLVRKDHKSGEILVWPHIEQTLTPTPANPFARVVPMKALDHFSSAGITLDESLRSVITEPDHGPDLGPDLPQGGEDPAMERLRVAIDQLEEVLKRLRD